MPAPRNRDYDPSVFDDDTESGFFSPSPRDIPVETKYESTQRTPFDEEKVVTDKPSGKTSDDKGGSAKKEKKVKKEEPDDEDDGASFWESFIGFFKDRRFRSTIGAILLIAAGYIFITGINSLGGAGVQDQSKIVSAPLDELAENSAEIQNVGGPVGAVVSHIVITNSIGLGSFVVVLYLVILSSMLCINWMRKNVGFWSLTFKMIVTTITVSVVAAAFDFNNETAILYGGQHGRMVVSTLNSYAGFISVIGLCTLLILITLFAYAGIFKAVFRGFKNLFRNLMPASGREKMPKPEDETQETSREAERLDVEENLDETTDEKSADGEGQGDSGEKNVTGEEYSEDIKGSDSEQKEPVTSKEDESLQPGVFVIETEEEARQKEERLKSETQDVKLTVDTPVIEMGDETEQKPYDPTAELSRYKFPPLDLLHEYDTDRMPVNLEDLENSKQRITQALAQYKIGIQSIEATVGPTVTLFEIVPAEGVKIQQIKSLENDLMLNLSATGIRIIAPMPGKGTIGIEVPNKEPKIVGIRSILGSKAFQDFSGELPIAIGATISNEVYIADLAKMPHLLVAGATGQGKSVGMNTIIASLLYKKHPATLKFVLIDPKFVEFSLYTKIERHYLAKLPEEDDAIITSPDRAVATLNSLCVEMDNRYALLRDAGSRTIKDYNRRFVARSLNPEKGHRYLPYIVVVVDEFADIIATAGKDIELPIGRITAKARAVGIHIILSTQRPSTNVITGTIKANVPARIAFKVSQMIDSRTIIDASGAQHLIGRGDMLFLNGSKIDRVQCALIDTDEVENVCEFIYNQVGYDHAYYLPEYNPNPGNGGNSGHVLDKDEYFEEAARSIVMSGQASTSSLQRRFSIGYNRAGKIMDQLEAAGVIGPPQGMKPRQILMDISQLEAFLETIG